MAVKSKPFLTSFNNISCVLIFACVMLFDIGQVFASEARIPSSIYDSKNNQDPIRTSEIPKETALNGFFERDKNTGARKKTIIGLLVPLSGPSAGIGQMMQNAAELALFDTGNPNLVVMPFDTGETKLSAEQAARDAMERKVDIILGPVFSEATKVVVPEVEAHSVNVISFSNDRTISDAGAYTLGFMPAEQIARVVDFAYAQGIRNFSALVPNDDFGALSLDVMQQTLRDKGLEVKSVERYKAIDETLSARIKALIVSTGGSLDPKRPSGLPEKSHAILVPEGGKNLQSIAARIFRHGVDSKHIRLIGSGQWDDTLTLSEEKLEGGWFASSAPTEREVFEKHFTAVYGYKPVRLASLAYDGISLVAMLAKNDDLSKSALTDDRGFSGVNGIFRFNNDGIPERRLSIMEVTKDGFRELDPAPANFRD